MDKEIIQDVIDIHIEEIRRIMKASISFNNTLIALVNECFVYYEALKDILDEVDNVES